MDENDAKVWLVTACAVPRETLDKLESFVALLAEENQRHNLVASASLDQVWARHIVDSAQLAQLCDPECALLLDLGSGAGLPGIVLALLQPKRPVALVESRRLRADWLERVRAALGMDNVVIEARPLERVTARIAGTITARAFAPLPRLFALAHRFSTAETRWVLPKGRSAVEELASVRDTWQCDAAMHKSFTNPEAHIIVARNVRPLKNVTR